MICRKLPPNSTKCSIMEGDVCYHYMVESGICYMTVTSTEYPKKLAFLYLAELCAAFEKELEGQWKSQSSHDPLRAITKPYSFMTFDRTIHKIKANFKDPNSSKALHMINNSLNEVTNIMRRNIDEILQRGENLEGNVFIGTTVTQQQISAAWQTGSKPKRSSSKHRHSFLPDKAC
ncbi:vesicle transport protein [Babesia ovata]|uniref:Vesicle transport protein n=1 Tax=Babesia ovata TaxID=189622 RepID=A0A2H6KEP3_9APIC|nr:vesicle transport protein [Babesia ovata]GBE61455.1 vesicle transport protein [Babesia ovata]